MKSFANTTAVLRPRFGVPTVGIPADVRGTAMPATGFRRTAAPLAAGAAAPLRTWSPLIT